TFTVRLPVGGPGTAPEQLNLGAAAAAPPAALPGSAGPTVLVIDDDAATRDLMRRLLVKDDYRVLEAEDGEAGLRAARDLRPDVITLDVLMPGMDGWAVLAALKQEPALAGIPVVMLTILDAERLGFSLGAAAFLTKPVEREALLAALQAVAPGRAHRSALLIEDDRATREMLRRILDKEGWGVLQAENGRVGLEQLVAHQPDLIILDLMMPEMDGFTFLEAKRASQAWRDIPVVVITARDLTPEDRQRLNGGVQQVVRKGSTGGLDLLQEVRSLVAAAGTTV
ncbi:MAG TPA: response regulator, partial [Gemmatimonadales bacterium]|nr:response regulator [Gemmatimonadales bacterium]